MPAEQAHRRVLMVCGRMSKAKARQRHSKRQITSLMAMCIFNKHLRHHTGSERANVPFMEAFSRNSSSGALKEMMQRTRKILFYVLYDAMGSQILFFIQFVASRRLVSRVPKCFLDSPPSNAHLSFYCSLLKASNNNVKSRLVH